MNDLCADIGYKSINHYGEELCGDKVEVLKTENGDISFMVYGHMGKGDYEGKTGILLYRYYRGEERIEEQLYLPVSESYQKIKEELGSLGYMNEFDVFFYD